ncbi:hypothetical protein ACSBR2_022587 [Camellia fascicularis]
MWKLRIPQKLKGFLWVVLNGKLLTNCMRMKRALTNDLSCISCNNMEDINHVLRTYPKARELWSSIFSTQWYLRMLNMSLMDWIRANVKNKTDACERDQELATSEDFFEMKKEHGLVAIMTDSKSAPVSKQNCGLFTRDLLYYFREDSPKLLLDGCRVSSPTAKGRPMRQIPILGIRGGYKNHSKRMRVKYVYADTLAKLGVKQRGDLLVVNEPLAKICNLLVVNMLGVERERP